MARNLDASSAYLRGFGDAIDAALALVTPPEVTK